MPKRKAASSSPSSLKAEKKRSDILQAARRCFHKNGFHQTSMQEICAAVGLGPGAVYRYFPSKQAIIEAMAHEERLEARAMIADLRSAEHFPDALGAITRAFAMRGRSNAEIGLMLEVYAEGSRAKRVATIIKNAEGEWVNALAQSIRIAQARGQIDPTVDARQTAFFITAIWDGLAIRTRFHPEEIAGSMADFFMDSLRNLLRRDPRRDRLLKSNFALTTEGSVDPASITEHTDVTDLRQLTLL